MLDIGAKRWEFVDESVTALMANSSAHEVSLKVYHFVTSDEDLDVSTLAVACQIVRELKAREREGQKLSKQALAFIERYNRCCKEGRSIDLTPQPQKAERTPIAPRGTMSKYVPYFVKTA